MKNDIEQKLKKWTQQPNEINILKLDSDEVDEITIPG